MLESGYRIKEILMRGLSFVDSPVILKNNEKEISIPALLEPGRNKPPANVIRNGER